MEKNHLKKYRLIREYPGSPKLGTILTYGRLIGDYAYDKNNINVFRHKSEIENYPEFWEEVIENNNPLNLVLGKTYKIRYKFCTSPIKICKVDRFTQHGYPWSNSLGGIITDSYELIEEVVEKDYEILTYRNFITGTVNFIGQRFLSNEGYREFTERDLNAINTPTRRKVYSIHSVKRLSDGEVFTIGDVCNPIGKYSYNIGTIDKIEFCKAGYLRLASKNWYMNIDGIEHSRKPLFTTKDGVDIYEGDTYFYFANESTFVKEATANNCFYPNNPFSTREAAEEYIISNKPCLSINELCTLPGLNMTNFREKLGKLVKSKL